MEDVRRKAEAAFLNCDWRTIASYRAEDAEGTREGLRTMISRFLHTAVAVQRHIDTILGPGYARITCRQYQFFTIKELHYEYQPLGLQGVEVEFWAISGQIGKPPEVAFAVIFPLEAFYDAEGYFRKLRAETEADKEFEALRKERDEMMFPTCQRCGSDLSQLGLCTDLTCPFSDCQQDDPRGWTGHPGPDNR